MKQLWLSFLVMVGALGPEEIIPLAEVHTSLVVFSDPHYYCPSLGTEGAAFSDYLSRDRKLLRESPEILDEALVFTGASKADIVLVPGDLTKDGTLASHKGFAARLSDLRAMGKQVLVVPGNHDVSNGEALAYRGDSTLRMENVDSTAFAEIYADFGYRDALDRDPHSLSYLAEPVPGLWILALDACLYDKNDSLGHPHTGAEFKKETLRWIKQVMDSEKSAGKVKIAMMHHGVLEHYQTQARYFDEYVVKDHRKISRLLAGLGVRVVFTGHYHANDITVKTWSNGSSLFDVETGSLVTYPCPVRTVDIRCDSLHIQTHHITTIPSMPEGFGDYARNFVMEGVAEVAEETMIEMNLRPEDASKLSHQIGEAFVQHYEGDEIPRDPILDLDSVQWKGKMIIAFRKKLVKGLYEDLPPADNQLSIHLPTGEFR